MGSSQGEWMGPQSTGLATNAPVIRDDEISLDIRLRRWLQITNFFLVCMVLLLSFSFISCADFYDQSENRLI